MKDKHLFSSLKEEYTHLKRTFWCKRNQTQEWIFWPRRLFQMHWSFHNPGTSWKQGPNQKCSYFKINIHPITPNLSIYLLFFSLVLLRFSSFCLLSKIECSVLRSHLQRCAVASKPICRKCVQCSSVREKMKERTKDENGKIATKKANE